MRGHEPFVKARQAGRKPADFVLVEFAPWPRDREYRAGRIFVEASDAIDRLDLRFLVGCDVLVSGSDAPRVERLYTALQRHKARRVIANCGRVEGGNGSLDFVLDTEEVLTWHA